MWRLKELHCSLNMFTEQGGGHESEVKPRKLTFRNLKRGHTLPNRLFLEPERRQPDSVYKCADLKGDKQRSRKAERYPVNLTFTQISHSHTPVQRATYPPRCARCLRISLLLEPVCPVLLDPTRPHDGRRRRNGVNQAELHVLHTAM